MRQTGANFGLTEGLRDGNPNIFTHTDIKQINGYIVVKQTRGCNTVAVKSAFDDILSSLHMSPCWRVAISRALLYFTLSTITIENYEGLRAFSGIA